MTAGRVTIVTDEGRALMQGVCVEKVVQLPRGRRFAIVTRDGNYSAETWQYREQAVDALRRKHGLLESSGTSPRRVIQ